MLTEGQDLGTITLGLGLAYAAWRYHRLGAGADAGRVRRAGTVTTANEPRASYVL